jgi:hypothetical protein
MAAMHCAVVPSSSQGGPEGPGVVAGAAVGVLLGLSFDDGIPPPPAVSLLDTLSC